MEYALDELARSHPHVGVTVIDTRGRFKHPIFSVGPLLVAAVRLAIICGLRRADVVHLNLSNGGSALRKSVLGGICIAFRTPTVFHLHSGLFPQFYERLPRAARWLLRKVLAHADRFFVLGGAWREFTVSTLRVPANRIRLVRLGVPGATAVRRTKADSSFTLLFVGRLGANKGVPELLEALRRVGARMRGWKCVLAGDGDVASFQELSRAMGLEDVTMFTGWLTHEEITLHLLQADCLVLPSHAEGLPVAVLEALGRGVPVVCTPVGGIPDIVEDGRNGTLVHPGDALRLAEALVRLCDDPRQRQRLAEAGHETWSELLSVEVCTQALVSAWLETLGRNGREMPGRCVA